MILLIISLFLLFLLFFIATILLNLSLWATGFERPWWHCYKNHLFLSVVVGFLLWVATISFLVFYNVILSSFCLLVAISLIYSLVRKYQQGLGVGKKIRFGSDILDEEID